MLLAVIVRCTIRVTPRSIREVRIHPKIVQIKPWRIVRITIRPFAIDGTTHPQPVTIIRPLKPTPSRIKSTQQLAKLLTPNICVNLDRLPFVPAQLLIVANDHVIRASLTSGVRVDRLRIITVPGSLLEPTRLLQTSRVAVLSDPFAPTSLNHVQWFLFLLCAASPDAPLKTRANCKMVAYL